MSRGAHDIIIIGGGINGLTCAAYLAKAGWKPLVLEQGPVVGGGAITGEIAPGFRAPVLSHSTGPLRRDVVDHLQLASYGLEFVKSDVDVALVGGAEPLVMWRDQKKTVEGLRRISAHDADAWMPFQQSRAAIGQVIASLFTATPPSVDEISGRDLWALLRTLRAFRGLDKRDAYRLLRWGPMAVADLVAEAFDTETLRAGVAATGIFGTNYGPWSAGSGLVLLLRAANDQLGDPQARAAKGGPGAIASAFAQAAERAGAEVRTGTHVRQVVVDDERARGVVLDDGGQIEARAVVSAVDPRQTFLRLCDPIDLAPEFLWRRARHRRQAESCAVGAAECHWRRARGAHRARAHLARHRLPRARIRSFEIRTLLDRAIHRVHDSNAARSIAGASRRTHPVSVCAVRAIYAP
jgi:phytoene dehydrogenase-like protein